MDAGAAPRGHDKKKKKHKKMRRLGVRIDMTPMVDVAFLLLTFFMLTTSMRRPQTMEINLPPEKAQVEVAESNLLTLRVKEDGAIYYNVGAEPPQKVEFKDLGNLVRQKNQQNPRLITLIKVDRKGKYHYMVDIMDELNLANINRFSLAPMLDADKQILQKVSS
ncbi:MAG: biopolymer transporter ExbD [Ignavibacteriae bacterium]|nr:biopolymer transporter ExbD [Ignavibacteria bacterium]MBI3365874.1 biopolymer transporter ExbD [Ignavibacteriota bacterium]